MPAVQQAAHAKSSTLYGRSDGVKSKFFRLDGLLLFRIIMGLRYERCDLRYNCNLVLTSFVLWTQWKCKRTLYDKNVNVILRAKNFNFSFIKFMYILELMLMNEKWCALLCMTHLTLGSVKVILFLIPFCEQEACSRCLICSPGQFLCENHNNIVHAGSRSLHHPEVWKVNPKGC